MPEIKLFEPARYNIRDHHWVEYKPPKSFILGDYTFILAKTELLDGPVDATGRWDFIGYEMTYTNVEVSQEERDRLWHQYLVDTGQSD